MEPLNHEAVLKLLRLNAFRPFCRENVMTQHTQTSCTVVRFERPTYRCAAQVFTNFWPCKCRFFIVVTASVWTAVRFKLQSFTLNVLSSNDCSSVHITAISQSIAACIAVWSHVHSNATYLFFSVPVCGPADQERVTCGGGELQKHTVTAKC